MLRSCSALSLGLFCLLARIGNAAEESGPSQAAHQAGLPYLKQLEEAAAAYGRRDFPKALEKLDLADQIQAEVPDTWNMRGAIYAEEHAYEKAEDAFEHAAKLEPGNFWPQYNLAQLQFMEKKYAAAAASFQKLLDDPQHRELIQFKLVMLDLVQGKRDDAKAIVDSMKVPSDTAAYYFANAALQFSRNDAKQGHYWVSSGLKIFGVGRSYQFYNTLADFGWVKKGNPAEAASSVAPMSMGSSTPPALPGSQTSLPPVNLQ